MDDDIFQAVLGVLLILGVAYGSKWLRPFTRMEPTLPLDDHSKPGMSSDNRRDWNKRLALCILMFLIISLTAYLCAWQQYRGWRLFRQDQWHTQFQFKTIADDIENYKAVKKRLPATLAELHPASGWPDEHDDRPVDYWHRPFHYKVDGDHFELYSYGRDGKPGGLGLDADIYHNRPRTNEQRLTLWQFSNAWGVVGILFVCILAGSIAIPLFFSFRTRPVSARPSLRKVVATAVFSIVFAAVISVFYLPNGH
jgi:hypothetical protein